MDVYYPQEMEQGTILPAVILVSGELPPEFIERGKDTGIYISYGQLIAASGLVAVTFNHRSLAGYTKLHEVGSDVDDLVSYVRENSQSLGIDADALCIWAFSSGPLYGLRTAMRGVPAYIRCIVSFYGGMSILNKNYFSYTPEEEPMMQEFSPDQDHALAQAGAQKLQQGLYFKQIFWRRTLFEQFGHKRDI